VRDGTWLSRFDGRTVTDPGEIDIDHLVPLANAAVPATSNRAKATRTRPSGGRRTGATGAGTPTTGWS
jgi:hypothetical protein